MISQIQSDPFLLGYSFFSKIIWRILGDFKIILPSVRQSVSHSVRLSVSTSVHQSVHRNLQSFSQPYPGSGLVLIKLNYKSSILLCKNIIFCDNSCLFFFFKSFLTLNFLIFKQEKVKLPRIKVPVPIALIDNNFVIMLTKISPLISLFKVINQNKIDVVLFF